MGHLARVPIAALSLERFREVLEDDGYRSLLDLRDRAAALLDGRVVWCVNSTAQGGGVAEMLRSLLAYTRGAGVDSRWSVLVADAGFFEIHTWARTARIRWSTRRARSCSRTSRPPRPTCSPAGASSGRGWTRHGRR